MSILLDTLHLYIIGILGWCLFKLFHVPVPALLGTIIIVGIWRTTHLYVPMSPQFLNPVVQIFLGLFIGSKITKEVTRQLKEIALPVLIIIVWAISIMFLLGALLTRVTFLDTYTAILSSSVAGLPEMTIIALETNADATIVVIAQTFRIIITIIVFPLIFKTWVLKNGKEDSDNKCTVSKNKYYQIIDKLIIFVKEVSRGTHHIQFLVSYFKNSNVCEAWGWGLLTLVIAVVGGSIFSLMGIPAGTMVGATIFVAGASMLGLKVKTPPLFVFGLLHIGLGLEVSKNISSETFDVLFSGELLQALLFITLIIFISSLFVAWFLHKVLKWDLSTSFLAAAPAGISVMTALAIEHEKKPLRVIMPHLFRLLAVKVIIPFVFMMLP